MPDIYMEHGSLTTATEDLNQSQNSMKNQLEDFISQLAPHLNNTEGDLKEAWNAVQNKVNSTTTRAHDAMGRAVTTLGQIHEAHITADRQGATMMGA